MIKNDITIEAGNESKIMIEKEIEFELENKAPSNLKQISVIIRTNFQDLIRSRKFLILLSIVLGVSLVLLLIIGKLILPLITLINTNSLMITKDMISVIPRYAGQAVKFVANTNN